MGAVFLLVKRRRYGNLLQMQTYIFGFGTLCNPKSHARTFAERDVTTGVILAGYQRALNAALATDRYVAMNLIENKDSKVEGIVAAVSEEDFPALLEREVGYDLVEVSAGLSHQFPLPVYAFIMTNPNATGKVASLAYLETCLGGVPASERERWLAETIIEHEIDDDRHAPLCRYYIPLDD